MTKQKRCPWCDKPVLGVRVGEQADTHLDPTPDPLGEYEVWRQRLPSGKWGAWKVRRENPGQIALMDDGNNRYNRHTCR